MANPIHLLVTPATNDGIPRMMQSIGRQYVPYFNFTHKWSGALWEGRYKSCVIEAEDYLLCCPRYIEPYPVRAGMVDQPEEYKWPGYQTNGLGKKIALHTQHQVYNRLGKSDKD